MKDYGVVKTGECIVSVQKQEKEWGICLGLRNFLGGMKLFVCVIVVCAGRTDKSIASLISVFTVWLIHLVVPILPSPVRNVS